MKADNCEIGPHGAKESGLVFMGDSFTRHLLPGLQDVAMRKNQTVRVNYHSGCPLFALGDWSFDRKQAEKKAGCGKFQNDRWALLKGRRVGGVAPFERNSTVVVAVRFEHRNEATFRQWATMLSKDLRAAGHGLGIVGEPPGMDATEKWRLTCLGVRQAPVGRFMGGSAMENCFAEWMKPRRMVLENSRRMDRILKQDVPETVYVDLFGELCREQDGEAFCGVLGRKVGEDGGYEEFGYNYDGSHLSFEGSRFVSTYFDKLFKGNL